MHAEVAAACGLCLGCRGLSRHVEDAAADNDASQGAASLDIITDVEQHVATLCRRHAHVRRPLHCTTTTSTTASTTAVEQGGCLWRDADEACGGGLESSAQLRERWAGQHVVPVPLLAAHDVVDNASGADANVQPQLLAFNHGTVHDAHTFHRTVQGLHQHGPQLVDRRMPATRRLLGMTGVFWYARWGTCPLRRLLLVVLAAKQHDDRITREPDDVAATHDDKVHHLPEIRVEDELQLLRAPQQRLCPRLSNLPDAPRFACRFLDLRAAAHAVKSRERRILRVRRSPRAAAGGAGLGRRVAGKIREFRVAADVEHDHYTVTYAGGVRLHFALPGEAFAQHDVRYVGCQGANDGVPLRQVRKPRQLAEGVGSGTEGQVATHSALLTCVQPRGKGLRVITGVSRWRLHGRPLACRCHDFIVLPRDLAVATRGYHPAERDSGVQRIFSAPCRGQPCRWAAQAPRARSTPRTPRAPNTRTIRRNSVLVRLAVGQVAPVQRGWGRDASQVGRVRLSIA